MKESKISVWSSGLIWFGAAISVAEILTGTLFAPLGFGKGLLAIVLGHIIGCTLLCLAGLIGGKTGKSAMDTVKLSFGEKGSYLFSSLNILQLLGWTAVMIFSGAAAASSVFPLAGPWSWSLIIGGLVLVWILIGIKNLGKVNLVAMSGLFILTVVLSTLIFRGNQEGLVAGSLPFGAALEFSIAMPLSWLPLISDYTRKAQKPVAATFVSGGIYFFASCWMYIIGMGAALFTGETDIAKIMMGAGLGLAAIFIIVFSTVTTTFLDVYSAGVSGESITKKLGEKPLAIVVCLLGTVLAIFTPITQYEGFLYFIGSVFAPMITILIVDFFVLKKDSGKKMIDGTNLLIWAIGFGIYRVFLTIDTPVGNTVPVVLITAILAILVGKIGGKRGKNV